MWLFWSAIVLTVISMAETSWFGNLSLFRSSPPQPKGKSLSIKHEQTPFNHCVVRVLSDLTNNSTVQILAFPVSDSFQSISPLFLHFRSTNYSVFRRPHVLGAIAPGAALADIKQVMETKISRKIVQDQQVLYHNGKELKNLLVLNEIGVEEGAVLYLAEKCSEWILFCEHLESNFSRMSMISRNSVCSANWMRLFIRCFLMSPIFDCSQPFDSFDFWNWFALISAFQIWYASIFILKQVFALGCGVIGTRPLKICWRE